MPTQVGNLAADWLCIKDETGILIVLCQQFASSPILVFSPTLYNLIVRCWWKNTNNGGRNQQNFMCFTLITLPSILFTLKLSYPTALINVNCAS